MIRKYFSQRTFIKDGEISNIKVGELYKKVPSLQKLKLFQVK